MSYPDRTRRFGDHELHPLTTATSDAEVVAVNQTRHGWQSPAINFRHRWNQAKECSAKKRRPRGRGSRGRFVLGPVTRGGAFTRDRPQALQFPSVSATGIWLTGLMERIMRD